MNCHLWDLLDQGVEKVLDRLQGEIGVTGLCIPVLCPPIETLRTDPGVEPRVFRTSGGAIFSPDKKHYSATRCLPPQSQWRYPRGALGQVVDSCRTRGLSCRFVLHVASAGLMTKRYEQLAAKNTFGDAWPDRICPVNPDVQAFIACTCADLIAQYQPDSIELADLHVGLVQHSGGSASMADILGSGGSALLNICFCESCRQLDVASLNDDQLDSAAAARSVAVRLNRLLDAGMPAQPPFSQICSNDAVVRAHVTAQWNAIKSLVQNVAKQGCDDVIIRCPLDALIADQDNTPWSAWATERLISALSICVDSPEERDILAAVQQSRSWTDSKVCSEIQIKVSPSKRRGTADESKSATPGDDGTTLVRNLALLSENGIAAVNLDHYGIIPAAGIAHLKQAVRFARRSPA